ncbi:hypothetical protein CSW35_05085 [Thermus scotoductus]|nr:hypothetical protein [Thermus scotoductus]RTH33458.1 hypothetical protein CSW35_05085 [Thermus scotoductus]
MVVITGRRFSGKGGELVRMIKRSVIARLRVLVIKPRLETRYHERQVVSHDGPRVEGMPVGLQVVGPYAEDGRVLAIGGWLEARLK